MPKLSNQEFARLRNENAQLRAALAALESQLERANESSVDLRRQLQETLAGNAELRALLADLQGKLDKLLEQTKKQRRRDYGPKTERHNPMPAATLDAIVKVPEADPPKNPEKRNHKKNIRFQNLPTELVPHSVKPDQRVCPDCAVETVFVGNKITYQLEKIIHSIKRLQHEQETRACPKCKQYIVTAEKPCPPIPGGLPGPCLLADTVVKKLADGLPQYRQSKILSREDATIPRSTLNDWFLASASVIELLYERLKRRVLASKVIQTDDCPVKVQNRNSKGSMRKGKMTVFRGDAEHALDAFDYSPDLSFARNNQFLKDFTGFVQADAAPGFDALFRDGSKKEVGCHAHSRRKYYELCKEIIALYGRLYDVERESRGKTPAQRLASRRRRSKPLIKKLHAKLLKLRSSLNPTNPLMEAIEYTLKHWIALTRFLKNPDLEIDNNGAERAIKDFVLARKNFLFIGSDRGGKAAAIHLSFVVSCKRNNIDPVAYLTDVFTRINSMKTSELDQLLPDHWAETRSDTNTHSSSRPP